MRHSSLVYRFVAIIVLMTTLAAAPGVQAATPQPQAAAGPVTSHPRLWLTQAELPRLRSWFTPTNPMYQNGLLVALNDAITTYNTRFFPGGQPNLSWPDTGSTNWEQYDTEAYAEFFAFVSLVDPTPANRILDAQRARALLMHVINEAVKGPAAGQPFRDPGFITYNRANYWGEAFGLTVDWLYSAVDGGGNPILTTQDKAKIRTVFLRWSDDLLHAATAGNEHPQPIGVMNDPQLLSDKEQLRWAANNYFTGHMRILTLLSLSIDAADDPPLDAAKPVTALGNTLRSYIGDATGAWLYQQYAVYEQAPAVISAYSLPANTSGLGVASGGLSVEGFLYGHALGYLTEALLALHTAGYDDPALSGPQINLIRSSFWDQMIAGFLNAITPTSVNPPASESYMGPLYQMASYGDILRFWITPDHFSTFAALGIYDQLSGNTTRLQAERWIGTNVIEGGAAKLYNRAGNVWGNAYASDAILYFMLFDPAAPTAPDPRPALPPSFYMPSTGQILARTDWSASASWFSYRCSWLTINHQNGDCNSFSFYRKGEWLTKERSGYPNDGNGYIPELYNTLGVQNSTPSGGAPSNLVWFEGPVWNHGGQFNNGQSAGDPVTVASFGNGFVYALGDATNLYNRPDIWTPANNAADITHVSRSIVWLKPDTIVIYDRAATLTADRFKRFNLDLVAAPVLNGHTFIETMPSGQKLTVQSLEPANATFTSVPIDGYNYPAEQDPITTRITIQDPTNPLQARFLTVLQASDAGVTPTAAAEAQVTGGTPFAITLVSNRAILFPVDMGTAPGHTVQTGAPFTGVIYLVPKTVTGQLITGLQPRAGYQVSITDAGSSFQVSVQPGSNVFADAGGVLALGDLASAQVKAYLPLIMH